MLPPGQPLLGLREQTGDDVVLPPRAPANSGGGNGGRGHWGP
jgi:hypothetical protein